MTTKLDELASCVTHFNSVASTSSYEVQSQTYSNVRQIREENALHRQDLYQQFMVLDSRNEQVLAELLNVKEQYACLVNFVSSSGLLDRNTQDGKLF